MSEKVSYLSNLGDKILCYLFSKIIDLCTPNTFYCVLFFFKVRIV